MEGSFIVELGKRFASGCTDFVVWIKKLGLKCGYEGG